MGAPTICAECRHVMRVRLDETPDADAHSDWWRCAASLREGINYRTGEKTVRAEYCDLINTDGECELYEGAEGEAA